MNPAGIFLLFCAIILLPPVSFLISIEVVFFAVVLAIKFNSWLVLFAVITTLSALAQSRKFFSVIAIIMSLLWGMQLGGELYKSLVFEKYQHLHALLLSICAGICIFNISLVKRAGIQIYKSIFLWFWRSQKFTSRPEIAATSANHETESGEEAYDASEGSPPGPCPYEVLHLTKNSSKEEVKKQYRELCKQYHPDRVNHLGPELQDLAKKRMSEINWAYETLTSEHFSV